MIHESKVSQEQISCILDILTSHVKSIDTLTSRIETLESSLKQTKHELETFRSNLNVK